MLPSGEPLGEPPRETKEEVRTETAAEADALSPINGGPMDLKWAVSVVADSWKLRRARAASEAAGPTTAA